MGSTGSDWFSGTAAATTGLGILTFTFAPLAIPIILLTIIAAVPLALPLIALAAIAAILNGAWRGVRAAGRSVRRLASSGSGAMPDRRECVT